MKIPRVDFSKIDKKFLIAIPIIILFLILNVWMNSSKKPSNPKTVNPPVQKEIASSEGDLVDLKAAQKRNQEELFAYHEQISAQENNQWNLNRGGFIARSGDYYYYAESKLGLLYRVSLDGTNRKKVDHMPSVNNLNIEDGWIYYTPRVFDSEGKKVSARVHKLNIQTGRKLSSNIHADIMILVDSSLYFTNLKDNRRIYRMDLEFQNVKAITQEDSVSNFFIEDGFLYYLTMQGIYRMEINGTQKNLEVPNTNIQTFIINDNWIYYIDDVNQNLFSVPVGSPSNRELLIRKAFDMHVYENFIYYTTSESGSFKVEKIGDLGIELGIAKRKDLNSIIGDVMFNGPDFNGFGFDTKVYLKNNEAEPLATDIRETQLGIDRGRINDFVSLQIDYDDKNTITRKIFMELENFFQGNSIPYYREFADIDQNYLNEGFIIFRQYAEESGAVIPGLLHLNGYQSGLIVLRWEGNRLNILGPYQLKNERKYTTGELLTPQLKLLDVTGDGVKEVVIESDSNNKRIKSLDLFSVLPVHIEPMDAENHQFRLTSLGYD